MTPRDASTEKPQTFGLTGAEIAVVQRSSRLRVAFQILQWLDLCGAVGGTTDEAESAIGLPHQTVSPRINELAHVGCVRRLDEKRETRFGSKAFIYVLGTADFKSFARFRTRRRQSAAGLSVRDKAMLEATRIFVAQRAKTRTQDAFKRAVVKLLADLDHLPSE